MGSVEIKRFGSLRESDEAEDDYYRGLSGEERLDILLELVRRYREASGEAAERFARVYRVTQLGAD